MISVEVNGQTLEFPDGTPPETMQAAIRAHVASAKPDRRSRREGIVDAFTQGVTAGFGDELTALESAVVGRPPGGGTFDVGDYNKSFGDRYSAALAAEREQQSQFRQDNPVMSLGSEIAGGVAGLVAGGRVPGAVGRALAPTFSGGVTGRSIAQGAGVGAGYGAVSGFGHGEGGMARRGEEALLGLGFGAAGGAASVPVAAGVSAAGRALVRRLGMDPASRQLSRAAQQEGVRPEAYDAMGDMLQRDTAMGGGIGNIRAADDGMLLDAGPYTTSTGRLVLNTPSGSAAGLQAVHQRAKVAADKLDAALDGHLGMRRGINAQARDNARASSAAREAAYQQAFDTPIDYTADGGRSVLNALKFIPKRDLGKSIQEANDALVADFGDDAIRGRQWNVKLSDDGAVEALTEMPNLRQLDALKRVLQERGREIDAFGRPTGAAIRAQKQAARLRQAMGQASEPYNTATRLGGDKIAVDNAIDLGRRILSPRVTREEVFEAVKNFGAAEKEAAKRALRQQLDDIAARIGPTQQGGDEAIREGYKLLRDLNTRDAGDKLKALMGGKEAAAFLSDVNRLATAFRTRSAVGMRSDTAANQLIREGLEESLPGRLPTDISMIGAATGGLNALRGATSAGRGKIRSDLYRDLSRMLTEKRGEDAVDLARRLMDVRQRNLALQGQPARYGTYGLPSVLPNLTQ